MFLLDFKCPPVGDIRHPVWAHSADAKHHYVGFIGKIIDYDSSSGTILFSKGSSIFRYPAFKGELEVTTAKQEFSVQCDPFDYLLFDDEPYVLGPSEITPALRKELESQYIQREEQMIKMIEADKLRVEKLKEYRAENGIL
jgi:hypothetical protein